MESSRSVGIRICCHVISCKTFTGGRFYGIPEKHLDEKGCTEVGPREDVRAILVGIGRSRFAEFADLKISLVSRNSKQRVQMDLRPVHPV